MLDIIVNVTRLLDWTDSTGHVGGRSAHVGLKLKTNQCLIS